MRSIEGTGRAVPYDGTSSANFMLVGKYLAAAKGDRQDAVNLAIKSGAPDRVVAVLKAGTPAGSTLTPWAAPSVDHGIVVGAFIDALRYEGVFYRLADLAFVKAPMRTRIVSVTSKATASAVGEGAPIPVSKIELAPGGLAPRKIAAMMVTTRELVESQTTEAEAFLSRELRKATNAAVDADFFGGIRDSSTTELSSAGNDAIGAVTDLRQLFTAIPGHGGARYCLILAADVAQTAWLTQRTDGGLLFPDLGPNGGEIAGIVTLVSDEIQSGEVWLLDCSGIAADVGRIDIALSRHASVQMDNMPASSPAALVSLFQTNSVALRIVAYLGYERIRGNAVAVLSGAAWGSGET